MVKENNQEYGNLKEFEIDGKGPKTERFDATNAINTVQTHNS